MSYTVLRFHSKHISSKIVEISWLLFWLEILLFPCFYFFKCHCFKDTDINFFVGDLRTVHLCIRLSDVKHVIIKQIPVEQMTKDERQAALNEVKVLSMLHHPNIIQYFENFLEDKALMIVMEYAQGKLSFQSCLIIACEGEGVMMFFFKMSSILICVLRMSVQVYVTSILIKIIIY